MSAALALQKALRARLVATPSVVALVPADAILDRNQRPVPIPSIVLGEAQVIDDGDDLQRRRVRIHHTVHIWKREPSLEGVTAISAAIRSAVRSARFDLGLGFHGADVRVSDMRAMRDPDGETSHGIVVVEAIVEETA